MKENILLVKFGALGDSIDTLWYLNSLSEQLNVSVLVLDKYSYIYRLVDKKFNTISIKSSKYKFLTIANLVYKSVINLFCNQKYVFVMQYSWKYRLFFLVFNPFSKVYSLKDLVELKSLRESRVDREIRLIEKFTRIKIKKKIPDFNFSLDEKVKIDGPYIAYAIGGGNFYDDARNRKGPVSQISESLAGISNLSLVLLGQGESDLMRAKEFIAQNKNIRILSYVNITDFMETVSIIANSNFFIGYDSALLKIANILRKKGIALLGPTPAYLILGEDSTITPITTDREISCMPCYKSSEGFKNMIFSCRDNVCIKSIAPAKINHVLLEGLKKIE